MLKNPKIYTIKSICISISTNQMCTNEIPRVIINYRRDILLKRLKIEFLINLIYSIGSHVILGCVL
jgi:hypothetical protein